MRENKRMVLLDEWEHRLMLSCLVTARNKFLEDGKPIEDVCEMIENTVHAPIKKVKKNSCREAR